jgi:hypothetical protein
MMAFVAQKELKVVDRQDRVTIYKAGDEIPDFESWDIHARQAHINLEWVKETKGKVLPFKPVEKPKKKKIKKSPDVSAAPTTLKVVEPPANTCQTCGKEFKSPKAVKTHATLAHRS